jgi:uncharacterized membrane protein YfcA
MEYWIIILISATAFGTAILTFFSGFGLGTILSPVFALFFPIDIAIALTAVVHFSSNLFKLSLMGKFASKEVLLKFAPTALIGALIGAYALGFLKDLTPIETHQWFGVTAEITWVKLIIAILLALFAIVELLPISEHFEMKKSHFVLGGLLSGFFGGLSSMQGAIRSAFLVKAGLSKETYIGTGVVIASVIDLGRMSLYSQQIPFSDLKAQWPLILPAIGSAIIGSIIGKRLLKKITIKSIQITVAVLLLLIAAALGIGII